MVTWGAPLPAANPHPLTSISGAVFSEGKDARIFYQASDGSLHALMGGTFNEYGVVVNAADVKQQTPLVSVLFYWKNQSNSRTFYLGKNNEIRCFSMQGGAPTHGALSGGAFVAAGYSKLGAFYWSKNDVPHVRVAFQKTDNTIQQIDWDGASDNFAFTPRGQSPATLAGTSLAFINQSPSGEDQYFRGFYQYNDNTLMELINQPPTYIGTMINGSKAEPQCTTIAANTVPDSRSLGHVGVYWVTQGGCLVRCAFKDGKWMSPSPLSGAQVKVGAGILAQAWKENGVLKERLFVMRDDGKMYSPVL